MFQLSAIDTNIPVRGTVADAPESRVRKVGAMNANTAPVNTGARTIQRDPKALLLWVRNTLGVTDSKSECGIGLCRASTLHLGTEAVPSCLATVGSATKAI